MLHPFQKWPGRPGYAVALALGGWLGNAAADTLLDLGTLGGPESAAFAVNNHGQVAGESDTPGSFRQAFVYRQCRMEMLSLGGVANGGAAYGINDAGWVVGSSNTAIDFYLYAFVFDGARMVDLGVDGSGELACGANSTANAVNESGWLAGAREVTAGSRQAFVYDGQTMHNLGAFGGVWAEAYGIDAQGRVVGAATDAAGDPHPFRFADGVLSNLGSLGGRRGAARQINDQGLIAGWSETSAGSHHAFLYAAGHMQDLGTLGGADSEAYGINEAGWVVGWSSLVDGHRHAFLYRDGVMNDLNERVPPGSGWILLDARSINDQKMVAGQMMDQAGRRHAYLLSPKPLDVCNTPVTPAGSDLVLTRTGLPEAAAAGQRLSYTLEIVQRGSVAASRVVLAETVAAMGKFISARPSQGQCRKKARQLLCQLDALEAGSRVRVAIEALAKRKPRPYSLPFKAGVNSQTADLNPADNNALTTLLVAPK